MKLESLSFNISLENELESTGALSTLTLCSRDEYRPLLKAHYLHLHVKFATWFFRVNAMIQPSTYPSKFERDVFWLHFLQPLHRIESKYFRGLLDKLYTLSAVLVLCIFLFGLITMFTASLRSGWRGRQTSWTSGGPFWWRYWWRYLPNRDLFCWLQQCSSSDSASSVRWWGGNFSSSTISVCRLMSLSSPTLFKSIIPIKCSAVLFLQLHYMHHTVLNS